MLTVAEMRFLETVPGILKDIHSELKKANENSTTAFQTTTTTSKGTEQIHKTFVKLKEQIPMEKMGANYPGPDSEKQFFYGDVVDWLRDEGYGKDHLLALLLIGDHAVSHLYDGNKNNK